MDNGTSDSKGANFELIDELSTAKQKICDENPTNSENDTEEEEEEEDGLSEDALLAQMGYAKSDEENEEEKDFSDKEILAQMGYAKTQPKRKTVNDKIEAALIRAQMGCPNKEPPKHEPITTPTSELKLVSALKGSRQKDGTSPKERRVSWDPDVYDPDPTYDKFLLAIKDDVNSKNKQKGGGRKAGGREGEEGEVKGKRGGGSKKKTAGKNKDKKYGEKKQGKKRGGGGGSGSKKSSEFGEF